MPNEQLTKWAAKLQSIAQAGLWYGQGDFDRERYQQIRDIAAEMMAAQSEQPLERVKDIFCGETGYQTPKLDTRAAIFQGDKVLLVKELDGQWSLPGGWVDADISVGQSAVKEVFEEAGLRAEIDLVVAIQDRELHNQPRYPWKVCKVLVLCTALSGAFAPNTETIESAYFSLDKLPPLSEQKNTAEQIALCLQAKQAQHWKTIIE